MSRHHTQWAGQFSVAGELSKRGYEVALTMGNHPNKDMMVVSPGGQHFAVDVKALSKKNYWQLASRPRHGVYYIFAHVPLNGSNDYFVLSGQDADNEYQAAIRAQRARGATVNRKRIGIPWQSAVPYGGCWHALPR